MFFLKKISWRPFVVASCVLSLAFVYGRFCHTSQKEVCLPAVALCGGWVDFDESLQLNRYAKTIQNQEWLTFFRQLYHKNNLSQVSPDFHPRIPLIIHHIWLGSKLPAQYAQLRESWFFYNPAWTFVFWTDNPDNYDQGTLVSAAQLEQELVHACPGAHFVVDVSSFSFGNKRFYDTAKNYGERSDLLRYDIMYHFGGLYADTDCECFKSFDLLHYTYDFYAGLHPLDTSYLQVGTALFATAPQHQIMEACVRTIKNTRHIPHIVFKTGPLYFSRIFFTIASQLDQEGTSLRNGIFPPTFFYPCDYNQRGTDKKEWLRPESFAAHHWEGSWLKNTAWIPGVHV